MSLKNLFLAFGFLFVLAGSANAQGWYEDFESGESPFGFELPDRGGSLGSAEDLDIEESDVVMGSRSAYLSESWDVATRELGIDEGLVTTWFRDSDYRGYEANSIRLRTTEEDGTTPGWPLDFAAVELRGQRSGHGGGSIDYYYAASPDPGGGGMGVDFGTDLMTGEYIARVTETWHEVSFSMIDGLTHVSIDGHATTLEVDSPLTHIDLLCRSGWYATRGGEAKAMLWDEIFVSPLINNGLFEPTPDWMMLSAGSADYSSVPSDDFIPLPGTTGATRLPAPEMSLTCPWNVESGMIEIWFWDGGYVAAGYKDILGIYNAENSDEYIRVTNYSQRMGMISEEYYASTHNTAHGGTAKAPKSSGWHRVIFRKAGNVLSVSVDGIQSTEVWIDPPDQLVLSLESGASNYMLGGGLWYGQIVVTGIPMASVSEWASF